MEMDRFKAEQAAGQHADHTRAETLAEEQAAGRQAVGVQLAKLQAEQEAGQNASRRSG